MIVLNILDEQPLWVQSIALFGAIALILGMASFMGNNNDD